MRYYNLNPKLYDGFRYQIPYTTQVPWSVVDWVCEDSNRRWRKGMFASENDKHYVELKTEEDLAYFLLKWA